MKILLSPLYLLSIPYGCAVRLRSALILRPSVQDKPLPCPVISVGNITVGGTGKTPLVIALATGLKERGIPVAILEQRIQGREDLRTGRERW